MIHPATAGPGSGAKGSLALLSPDRFRPSVFQLHEENYPFEAAAVRWGEGSWEFIVFHTVCSSFFRTMNAISHGLRQQPKISSSATTESVSRSIDAAAVP